MTELGRIKNVANQLWDIIDTARSNFGEDGYKALNKAVEAVQNAWWVCKNGQEEKLKNAYHTPVNNSRKPIKSSEDKEDEDTVDEKMRSFINQVEKDFHCEVFDNFGKSSVYLKLNSEPDVIKKLDYKKSNGEYEVTGEPVDFITKEDIENELDALMSKKKFGLDKDTYEETVEYILSFFEEKYFPDSAKQAVADWYNDTVQFFPEMFEKGEKRKLASAAYLKKIRSSKLIKSSRYYTKNNNWKYNSAVIPVSKNEVMSFFEDGTWNWDETVAIVGEIDTNNTVRPAVIFGSNGTYSQIEKGRGLYNDQSLNDIGYFSFRNYSNDPSVFNIPGARYFVLK